MSDDRRLKRVNFDRMFLHAGWDAKSLLLQIADQLPWDARLVGFGEDFSRAVSFMVFWSSTFNEVDEAHILPELAIELRSDYRPSAAQAPFLIPAGTDIDKHLSLRPGAVTYATPVISGVCSCDVGYTGAHKWDCPLGRKP